MQCSDKNRIIEYLNKNLTEKRQIHTFAVVREAKALAERYGEDIEKAEIAALCHDLFRDVSKKAVNGYVRQLSLDQAYLNNCNLAHSKIAAIVMVRDFGIHDSDIINAVSYHTTGRAHMSLLEKILYLADAIEPNRSYPGVDEIRKIAYENLDRACLMSLNCAIQYIKHLGIYLDNDTVMARDNLNKEIGSKNLQIIDL